LYVVVGSKLAWNAVGPSAITFREWVDLTFAFPISTLSLSTYDGTLPAPLFSAAGVAIAGVVFRARSKISRNYELHLFTGPWSAAVLPLPTRVATTTGILKLTIHYSQFAIRDL
jgi:hypothetical protein